MSSETYDPATDPICSGNGPIPNADMSGIAVAVANVIANLCLRIMVTWSPEDVDVGIQSLLIQFYPILLSTLLSISRQQLARADALFALTLSSSPLTIYLVAASICNLRGIHTGLYKRIKSHRFVTSILGALVLAIWTGLSMAYSISPSAFKDSPCETRSFVDWLLYISITLLNFLMFLGGIIAGLEWIIIIPLVSTFLARRWSQLRADVKLHSEGAPRLRVLYTWVKFAWCTIDHNHKWFVYILFAYIDACWAYQVIFISVSLSENGYVLSYGQILSAFFAVPTLVSTAKLVYFHRLSLLRFLQRLPELYRAEVLYLCTGKEPGPTVQDSHLPFNITSHPAKPILGKPRDQIVMNIRSARQRCQPPLLPELDYAMQGGRERDPGKTLY